MVGAVWVMALVTALPVRAQVVRELRLLSEFQRIDPFGEILPVDRSPKSREILSPAVAANSFYSVQFAVTADPKSTYFLAIQSYPADVFQWKVYRMSYTRSGEEWIPDRLIEERPPYFETMPDASVNIPGQKTQAYLLDVWIPPGTPSSGARLEVLVKSDTWRIAPMEMRILPVTIPKTTAAAGAPTTIEDVALPADATAAAALSRFVANESLGPAPQQPDTLRAIIYRNALQDFALSKTLAPNQADRCWDAISNRKGMGAEWYLRVRDCVYRTAWKK